MTYRCKVNPSCLHKDLPEDCSLLCVCAAEGNGKVSKEDLQRLREIKAMRLMRENTVLDGVSVEVGRLVTLLNQSEAAA